jgi:hypothetical protein
MPTLRRRIVTAPSMPQGRPPEGWAFCYSLAHSPDGARFYVGQTQLAPTDRLARHISLAQLRAGGNRRLEARIRRLAEGGDELVMRVESVSPAGDEADAAERACIAECRAELGAALLNQGSGDERSPTGRLIHPEGGLRTRLARRAEQRETRYRRSQALAAARAAQVRQNAFRAEEGARAGVAVASALRAYLAASPGAALADIARDHGLDGRSLQEAVRGRERGIPEALACAVRARVNEDVRLCGQALGHRAARVEPRQLRWLMTAYARPGSLLTLTAIAARLGITKGTISHLIAGRKGRPLPRQLLRACRARAQVERRGAFRPRGAR